MLLIQYFSIYSITVILYSTCVLVRFHWGHGGVRAVVYTGSGPPVCSSLRSGRKDAGRGSQPVGLWSPTRPGHDGKSHQTTSEVNALIRDLKWYLNWRWDADNLENLYFWNNVHWWCIHWIVNRLDVDFDMIDWMFLVQESVFPCVVSHSDGCEAGVCNGRRRSET